MVVASMFGHLGGVEVGSTEQEEDTVGQEARIGPSDLCNTGSSMHRGCLEREDWCVGTPESAATLDLVVCVQCSVWVDECVHGFAPNVEADTDHLTPCANVRVWILLLDERLVFGDPGTDKMFTN